MPNDTGNKTARFPTTHWSDVARAGGVDPLAKREALGRLLVTYLPAFRAHLMGRKQIRADDADDLLQGFVCDQIVADDLISCIDRTRGRFRGFVLVALDRYVRRVWRSERAEKRAPVTPLLQLNDQQAAPAQADDAVDVFDLAWARQIVERAITETRSRCQVGRQEQVWEVFRCCVLAPLLEETPQPSHRELMHQLGFGSPQQVSNTLVTGKRLFARMLRRVVGEYASDEDEVEAELRDLWTILAYGGAGVTIGTA